MSVNNTNLALTYEQSATLLNDIMEQATGRAVLDEINTGDFTSIYSQAMKAGYDPLLKAISGVLSETIPYINPYSRKLKSLYATADRWGAISRELTIADRPIMNDERMDLTDGQTYSPYKVRHPQVFETSCAGANQFEDYVTIYKDQLDTAFQGLNQFNAFLNMVIQNMLDKLEQYKEQESRACLCNLIGGTIASDKIQPKARVRYLLTEFQEFRGDDAPLTVAELFGSTDNLIPFAQWFFGEMKTTVRKMGERSTLFHTCPIDEDGNEYPVQDHTDPSDMVAYFLSEFFDKIDTFVLNGNGMFNTEYLKPVAYEGVTYWQSILNPSAIDVNASFWNPTTGGVSDSRQNHAYVLGVLFNKNCAGIRELSTWQADTPMNPRNGTVTKWYHSRTQWKNNNAHPAVVFLLESEPVTGDSTEPH